MRVTEAPVDAPDEVGVRTEVARIGAGGVLLVGVTHEDTGPDADRLAERIANLRIHADEDGVIHHPLLQRLGALKIKIATGWFRTQMHVALVNDGPAPALVGSRPSYTCLD